MRRPPAAGSRAPQRAGQGPFRRRCRAGRQRRPRRAPRGPAASPSAATSVGRPPQRRSAAPPCAR
eukprot:6181576-Pleurochrysis_carterae.AAC.1